MYERCVRILSNVWRILNIYDERCARSISNVQRLSNILITCTESSWLCSIHEKSWLVQELFFLVLLCLYDKLWCNTACFWMQKRRFRLTYHKSIPTLLLIHICFPHARKIVKLLFAWKGLRNLRIPCLLRHACTTMWYLICLEKMNKMDVTTTHFPWTINRIPSNQRKNVTCRNCSLYNFLIPLPAYQ